jgi:hypothetical protein
LTRCYEDQVETFKFKRYLERLNREELITRITQLQNGELHAKAMLLLKTLLQDYAEGGEPDGTSEYAYDCYRGDEEILFNDTDLKSDLPSWNPFLEPCGEIPPPWPKLGNVTLLLIIRKAQALHKVVVEVFEKNYFDRATRMSLLSRLELLDTYFEDACYTANISPKPLAYLGSDKDSKYIQVILYGLKTLTYHLQEQARPRR